MIDATDLAAFLIGVATGAAGQYFADKYTDQRRRHDESQSSARLFRDVAQQMPKLIAEMAADVQGAQGTYVRNFVLLPSKTAHYSSGREQVFGYYETEHRNLRGQFAILENSGYVFDVTSGNAPTFRASEEFVQRLRSFRHEESGAAPGSRT